eukprot:TRINITY_DN8433_c0_g1_i2.p2 TRINITY_DN8433_c0_g1~~TRINITY_DN8433_c0_g1_i2.p2  ORF type:complete len:107 (-),score=4.96 TRINITY_DN8433_c0_g1_i2:64-384(-)
MTRAECLSGSGCPPTFHICLVCLTQPCFEVSGEAASPTSPSLYSTLWTDSAASNSASLLFWLISTRLSAPCVLTRMARRDLMTRFQPSKKRTPQRRSPPRQRLPPP